MKRILHTFLLTLLMLILGGYSRAYAHSKASLSIHTSPHSHRLPAENLFTRPGSSSSEKQNQDMILPVFENEEEDDDLGSFKKHLENGNLPTSILFSHLAWPFITLPEKVKPFRYSFSGSSSWYLVLQVFRI